VGLRERLVVFTDLDGTLLDPVSYDYEQAQESLRLLRRERVPVVFCSAKTRAEQIMLQDRLQITDPFVVENGGALFVKKGYFPFPVTQHRSSDDYEVIEFGVRYGTIRQALNTIRREIGFSFMGFGDMNVDEVARETGLDHESAKRAMEREYSETIKFESPTEDLVEFQQALAEQRLQCVFGGRFYNIIGAHDKGKAVEILTELYKTRWGAVTTIGLGDSANDTALLSAVHIPVLVQKPGGVWEDMEVSDLVRAEGVGPVGWNRWVLDFLGKDRNSRLTRRMTGPRGKDVPDV